MTFELRRIVVRSADIVLMWHDRPMRRKPKKNTKAEDAYIRDLKRTSTFEKAERGEAQLLSPDEYPEPVKRFLARERRMVHIKLSAASKRKLDAVSRAKRTPMERLARKWIE